MIGRQGLSGAALCRAGRARDTSWNAGHLSCRCVSGGGWVELLESQMREGRVSGSPSKQRDEDGSTATAASEERSVGFGQSCVYNHKTISTRQPRPRRPRQAWQERRRAAWRRDGGPQIKRGGLERRLGWENGWAVLKLFLWPPASVRRLGPSFYTASRTSTKSSEAAAAGADGGAGLRGSGADGGRGSDDKRMDKRGAFPHCDGCAFTSFGPLPPTHSGR